jgi:hypothetical protein
MPNVTEGWAIVIAAFISVAGMVLTQFFNWLQNRSQRKQDSLERFFYEVYLKRITLYEDITKELEAIIESGQSLFGPDLTREAVADKISKDTHSLDTLLSRLKIFGSRSTIRIFIALLDKAHDIYTDLKQGHYFPLLLGGWNETVRETLFKFVQLVREEGGSTIIDSSIKKYLSIEKAQEKAHCTPILIDKLSDLFLCMRFKRIWRKINKRSKKFDKKRYYDKTTPIDD